MRLGKNRLAVVAASLMATHCALSDSVMVEVRECVSLAGVLHAAYATNYCDTGEIYYTADAPKVDGYVFTHWCVKEEPGLEFRDAFGRAMDYAAVIPLQGITMVANYAARGVDSDSDGIDDGWELYWYGDLDESAETDTDGDGLPFAEELANGASPLFPNRRQDGLVRKALSGLVQFNPLGSAGFVVRIGNDSVTNYVVIGETVSTPVLSPLDSAFAYWEVNGERAQDAFGRALDGVTLPMPDSEVEFVAVTEQDEAARLALYWYGRPDVQPDSDTDGDGLTFAEEIARGTNPLLPDSRQEGRVCKAVWDDVVFNPYGYAGYAIRTGEGSLTDIVAPGTLVRTPVLSPFEPGSSFAYWQVNGERAQDAFGRALDSVSVAVGDSLLELQAVYIDDIDSRWKLYWYGRTDVAMDSDTDGDGFTLAEEIVNGTNPLFADAVQHGKIKKGVSSSIEINGQIYERVEGVVLDGEYASFFDSETFGEDLQPIVWDLNGDGLFDLVLVYNGGYKTFVNVGYHGNPEFEERKDVPISGVDLAMNDVARLAALELDVAAPDDALSATTNGASLLVSDGAGRIWYYEGKGDSSLESLSSLSSLSFSLQHKVWGGSHAGFAEGLRLAAVDWDEDGDLDCLAGTAAGKLMLLRDPKVGRPTNLKAEAGVDTVVLTWDPNQQSRIRGYRVYRTEEANGTGESSLESLSSLSSLSFSRIASPQLPTYRDQPPEIATYDYKVSSVSRFYTAGNSTPTITESPATEAVRATLGGVKFDWLDANTKVGEQVEVVISIENALNYNVAGRSQVVTYDPEYLAPMKVVKSGLTEDISLTETVLPAQSGASPSGQWKVSMTSGVLPAGSGRFLTFVFEALKEGTTTVGGEKGATVSIAAGSALAPYQLGDLDGNGEVGEPDLRLLAKLKSAAGRKYTASQLKAGDFNGNGKLDDADYQALRALLKEKGLLSAGGGL